MFKALMDHTLHGVNYVRDPLDAQTALRASQRLHDPCAPLRRKWLDITRFNEAFMLRMSTSPQQGIIARKVAAAMLEQPAGRTLLQEMIDEALAFRPAMVAVQHQIHGSRRVQGTAAGAARQDRSYQPAGTPALRIGIILG